MQESLKLFKLAGRYYFIACLFWTLLASNYLPGVHVGALILCGAPETATAFVVALAGTALAAHPTRRHRRFKAGPPAAYNSNYYNSQAEFHRLIHSYRLHPNADHSPYSQDYGRPYYAGVLVHSEDQRGATPSTSANSRVRRQNVFGGPNDSPNHIGHPSGNCLGREDQYVCNQTQAGVCLKQVCVSACSSRALRACLCEDADDRFCYLCCGSASNECKPAHEYGIFTPNGQRYERNECKLCHQLANGVHCDERSRRVCYNNRCAAGICNGKPEGAHCTKNLLSICVDGECRDLCREHGQNLYTCDCDVHSEDRCQLCCYNSRTQRCESAYKQHKIKKADGRPVLRVGLKCRRGLTCNNYGVCRGAALAPKFALLLCMLILLKHVV